MLLVLKDDNWQDLLADASGTASPAMLFYIRLTIIVSVFDHATVQI